MYAVMQRMTGAETLTMDAGKRNENYESDDVELQSNREDSADFA